VNPRLQKSRVTTFLSIALYLLAGYLAVTGLAWWLQPRLTFFPSPASDVDPGALGLDHSEVHFTASDGVLLHAWFFPAVSADEGPGTAVLVSHGNAGNIGNRLHLAQAFLAMGHSVLLYDYRGFGASEGRPSEEGTYLDAVAAHDWLTGERGFRAERIVAYGESIGCGVTVGLAGRRRTGAVVLESGFTSIVDIAAGLYPWLPVRTFSRYSYDNEGRVGALGVPVLVVHSRTDEIVPFAHAQRVFAAATEPKAFLETGGGHNEGGFTARGEWWEGVQGFLRTALQAR